jgi:hypothetical protein
MSTIIVNGAFDDASLPIDADLRTDLLLDAAITSWHQADPDTVVEASGVASWVNLKSGAGSLTAVGTGSLPALVAQADMMNFEFCDFSSASGSRRYAFSNYPAISSAFSVVLLAKLSPSTTAQKILYIEGASAGVGPFFIQIAGHPTYLTATAFYGAGGSGLVLIPSALAIDAQTTVFIVVSRSGDGKIKAIVNNTAIPEVTAGAFSPGVNAWLGSKENALDIFRGGSVSDVLFSDVDLLSSGQSALMKKIKDYFNGTYGLSII